MVSFYGSNAFYGTATYSNPVFITFEAAGLSFESVARAFTGDSGLIRILTITASDPLTANALSSVAASYLLEQSVVLPTLSEITVFNAGSVIDAVAMNENFLILAQTVSSSSTSEEMSIPEVLSFLGTGASISARSDQGLFLSHQAKQKSEALPQTFRRPMPNRESSSAALRLENGRVSLLTGSAERGETTVNLDQSVVWADKLMWITAPFNAASANDRRMTFRALNTPVLLTGLKKNVTTTQEIELPAINRRYGMLELSIRAGVKGSGSFSVKVHGKGDSTESGFTLHIPEMTGTTAERFVTKRVRVPVSNASLVVTLSNQCTTLEIRILGTWR